MASRLLCVDDDAAGLFLRKRMLEQEGYRVLIASNGKQALCLVKSTHVDAVILDFNMPDMDGGEVAQRLRREFPHLKIVILTGYPDVVSPNIRGLVDGFVCKGGNTHDLLLAVRTALDGTRRQVA